MPDFRDGQRLGVLYEIHKPIDRPEGAFARVYLADDLLHGDQVAFKVMRQEHLKKEDKYQAFLIEAQLLTELKGDSNVMQLHGWGYLQSSDKDYVPIACSSVDEFSQRLPEAIAQNWRPYLALELMKNEQCLSLFNLVRQNSRGLRLPTEEALELSIQLADLYVRIHEKGIIYHDAKPEHAYWRRSQSRDWEKKMGKVVLIDWNVSRHFSPQEAEFAKKRDIMHLGQGILFPAFVGLDFGTGEVPEAKPTPSFDGVSMRYVLDKKVEFYDQEEWLDQPVRRILERAVAKNGYDSAGDLLDDLRECAATLGRAFSDRPPTAQAAQIQAYQNMQNGLELIIQAQENIRQARSILEQAVLKFPRHDREIQRLINEATDFWNQRVVP